MQSRWGCAGASAVPMRVVLAVPGRAWCRCQDTLPCGTESAHLKGAAHRVAALHDALPGWLARTVHVPMARNVVMWPLTPPAVQTDGAAVVKGTGRSLVAFAVTVSGDWVRVLLAIAGNVMVCVAFATVELRLTGAAALQVASPAWLTRTMHVSTARDVMTLPSIPPAVHTARCRRRRERHDQTARRADTVTGNCGNVLAIGHSDVGSQYISIAYTDRLHETRGAPGSFR